MKQNLSSAFIAVLCIIVSLSSCKKNDREHGQMFTFYGSQVSMGDGHARSFITTNNRGIPQEIGIEMTDGALQGLPTDPKDFAASFFPLPLHKKAKELTAFNHIGINWNVHGHEPEHIYDVPHFDFHFYEITLDEQLAIPPYEIAPAAFDIFPAPEYMPANYVAGPGGVPQMGKHWSDILSPEFHGSPFTYTLVYGSYAGRNTFIEPMITLAILQSGISYEIPYRQPELFSPSNKYYPSQYNIYKNNATGMHYVTLSHFTWH